MTDPTPTETPPSAPPRKRAVIFWSLLAATAVAWGATAFWLARWLPEQEVEAAVADVRDGPRLARGVQQLCAMGDDGRERLLQLWQAEPSEARRDLMARAMLSFDCLDLLPQDARDAFELRHASWRLDQHAGNAEALLDILVDAPDELARKRAADLLAESPLDGLDPEQRATLRALAAAHPDQPWALALIDALGDDDAIALLLAWHADAEPDSARAAQLERMLQRHWTALPAEEREARIDQWLEAHIVVRKNGAVNAIQPLRVEATWAPTELHGPLAGAVAFVRPAEIVVDGKPAELAGRPLAAHIGQHTFDAPGYWQRTIDLAPVTNKNGRWQLAGKLEVALLPAEARGAQLTDDAGELTLEWRQRALYLGERPLREFTYRLYLNPESGLPERDQSKEARTRVTQNVELELELEAPDGTLQQVALHKGGKRQEDGRSGLRARHGRRAHLVVSAIGDPASDLAVRVQARTRDMPPEAWHDLGQGIVRRDDLWPSMHPARIPIDLGPVCRETGPCRIALRLRDSLLVGRTDARIQSYWGHTLELGIVELDLDNAAAGKQWRDLQRRLRR